MKSADREAALLVKLARVRAGVVDIAEELSEAGLVKTAGQVTIAGQVLEEAKETLMSAIRESGEAAGRKR